jgi:hypothetical protein
MTPTPHNYSDLEEVIMSFTGRFTGSSAPAFAPTAAAIVGNPDAPATDKQMGYLRSLGHEHAIGMTVEDFDIMLDVWRDAGLCTKGFVSEKIGEYKSFPKRPVKETEPGYYTKDGKYYVVVLNKAKTHSYAKELTTSPGGKWTWEYVPGAVRKLGDLEPLTLEEAAKWGHLNGKCIICMRPLTDPKSVTDGIGPVCAKKVKR